MMKRFVLAPFAMIALALLVCTPSCSAVQDEARAVAKNVVDCTTSTAKQAIHEYGPTVTQVLVDSLAGDGKIDRDRVKTVAATYASDAARCVLAATIARLQRPAPSSPDGVQASPLPIDQAELAAAWKDVRTTQFGGADFKLETGP